MNSKHLKKCIYLQYHPKIIAGFRRKALATPNEILAWLVGECWVEDGLTRVRIDELVYPELATSTPDECEPVDIPHPKGYLGSIHSHPEVPWIGQSLADHHGSILENEKLYGIYSYYTAEGHRRCSRLEWYALGKIVVLNQ